MQIPIQYGLDMLVDGDILVYRFGYSPNCEDLDDVRKGLDRYLGYLKFKLRPKGHQIWISSADKADNYRYQVKSKVPYKGHRGGQRPRLYAEIRRLLVDEYDAQIWSNGEADDAMGVMQHRKSVIITIDKDLLMIPGYHYNPDKQIFRKVTDPGQLELSVSTSNKKVLTGTGFKWFCAQMIMGDTADNIKGLPRKGAVFAYNNLTKYDDCAKLWCKTRLLYRKMGLYPEQFEANAQLLWIQRQEGWTVPHIKKRKLI